jgi:hypothetical protein
MDNIIALSSPKWSIFKCFEKSQNGDNDIQGIIF